MIRELQLRRRTGPAIVSERVRVRLRRDEKVFDILRSVTFIATFASRAKSIAHVHDVHESLMFLPDCTLAFRGIFSSENRNPMKTELKTRPCLKAVFSTRFSLDF